MAGRSVPAFGRRLPTAARLFLAPLGPLTPPQRTGQGKGASDTSPVGRRGTPLLWPPPRRAVSRDGASPPEWRPRPDVTALPLDLSDLGDPRVARLASSTAAARAPLLLFASSMTRVNARSLDAVKAGDRRNRKWSPTFQRGDELSCGRATR